MTEEDRGTTITEIITETTTQTEMVIAITTITTIQTEVTITGVEADPKIHIQSPTLSTKNGEILKSNRTYDLLVITIEKIWISTTMIRITRIIKDSHIIDIELITMNSMMTKCIINSLKKANHMHLLLCSKPFINNNQNSI